MRSRPRKPRAADLILNAHLARLEKARLEAEAANAGLLALAEKLIASGRKVEEELR